MPVTNISARWGSDGSQIFSDKGTARDLLQLDATNAAAKLPTRLLLGVSTVAAAGAGSNASDATALGSTAAVHVVTAGDDDKGVVLPAAVAGDVKIILNSGSAGLKIWPATDDKINNGSANAAIVILENTCAILVATAGDNWAAVYTANS